MRQAAWRYIEATPALERMYRACRRLPAPVRAPLRALGTPLWTVVARLVLSRSRERVVAGPFRGMALELAPVSRRQGSTGIVLPRRGLYNLFISHGRFLSRSFMGCLPNSRRHQGIVFQVPSCPIPNHTKFAGSAVSCLLHRGYRMLDVLFVAGGLAFFSIATGYAVLCERL